MTECQFCASLEVFNRVVATTNEINKKHYPNRKKYYADYSVALVVKRWYHGNKSGCSTITDYRFRGNGYKLNYCPECGRKLNE